AVRRLDDQVDVVALHGELEQPEPEPLAAARERALQRPEAPVRAEVPDLPAQADGDVHGGFAELRTRPVRDVRLRRHAFPPRSRTRATPGAKRKILLSRTHGASVPRGSDIVCPARSEWGVRPFK